MRLQLVFGALPLRVVAAQLVIPISLSSFYTEIPLKPQTCLLKKCLHSIFIILFVLLLTAVHSFYVNFKFLWLTKLSTAKIAQWPRSVWICRTTISSMHFQIIKTQEKLKYKFDIGIC